jgi:hypothetical protein
MTDPAGPPGGPVARLVRAVQDRGLVAVGAVFVLFALLVELGVFGFPHWASLAAGDEITVTPDNATLDNVAWNGDEGYFQLTAGHGQVGIEGFDAVVKTVWIEPVFFQSNTRQAVKVHYDDEGAADRNTGSLDLVEGVERNDYVIPTAMGHVTRVAVEFDSDDAVMGIRQIVLNKTVPLFFNPLRVVVMAGLALLVYWLLHEGLWRHPLNPASRRQQVANGLLVGGCIVLLGAAVTAGQTIEGFAQTWRNLMTADYHQYAKLVDALLHGHVALEQVPDQSLLDATDPYDIVYRWHNNTSYEWDYSYYNGKYYCYFGIVPALLLFLPGKVITGQHVSTAFATFLFSAVATWFLYLLWRAVVRRWFPKLPYVLYALGGFALFAVSQLVWAQNRPGMYEVALSAGAMFVFLGVWALFKATARRRLSLRWTGAAALALALAVGCRPNLVFVSALVPVMLWPRLPRRVPAPAAGHALDGPRAQAAPAPGPVDWRATCRILLTVALPYVVVAAGLIAYNVARFGQIAEFGASYQLTITNVGAYGHRGLFGSLLAAGYGVFAYLFTGLKLRPLYPFAQPVYAPMGGFMSYMYAELTPGLGRLPLLWALLAAPRLGVGFKARRPLGRIMATLALLGLAEAAFISVMGGVIGRYEVDFAWLLALPALVCLVLVYERGLRARLSNGKLIAAAAAVLLVTAVTSLLLDATGEFNQFFSRNPALFYDVQNFFRFW